MKHFAHSNGGRLYAGQPLSPGVRARYDKPAIFLHWAIFVLVFIAYTAINLRGPKGSESREFWIGIHVWAGLLVLGLSIVRLGWRWTHGPPPMESGAAIMRWLAKASHVALYAFVILQPLLGILTFNLDGHPVTLSGLNVSFSIVGPNPALAPLAEEIHEGVANIFYYVIGLHALAALWHHYVLKDDTLRRMI